MAGNCHRSLFDAAAYIFGGICKFGIKMDTALASREHHFMRVAGKPYWRMIYGNRIETSFVQFIRNV